ncbi:MAG: hypothetical protein RR765_09225 [Peptostreptococcaceae bacterium]
MKDIKIKLTNANFNFRFKQYEGKFFHASINEETQVVKYKISNDDKCLELKEFGNTHIKDNNMLYIPQIEAYIDLNTIRK